MTNPAQSYNLEQLKTIAEFFQSKILDPKIPFYEIQSATFLNTHKWNESNKTYPEKYRDIFLTNQLSNKNIKTISNKMNTNPYTILEYLNKEEYEDKKFEIIFNSDRKENTEYIIEKIVNKLKTDHLYKILESLHKECEEEEFEIFDEKARQNAQQILDFLCKKFPQHDFDIYPTENREIAICYTPCKGCSILIICDSNGSVAYFKILNGRKSRYRCEDITDFPFDQLDKEKGFESLKSNNDPMSLKNNENFRINNNEYKIA